MRYRSMCISAADAARSSTFRAHAETNRLTRYHCPARSEVPSARSRRTVTISAIMLSASTVTVLGHVLIPNRSAIRPARPATIVKSIPSPDAASRNVEVAGRVSLRWRFLL